MLLVRTGLFQAPTRLLRAGQRQSTWFWSTYVLRSGSFSGWSMLEGSQSFSFPAGSAHLKGVSVSLYMFVRDKAASSMFQHAYSTCKPASSMFAWYQLTFPCHCFKFCKQISSSRTSHISPILCIGNNSWKKLCCALLALSPFKMINPLSGNRPKSASNKVENMLQAGISMFQAGRNMFWHVSNTLMKIQCHPTCICYIWLGKWRWHVEQNNASTASPLVNGAGLAALDVNVMVPCLVETGSGIMFCLGDWKSAENNATQR